MVFEVDECLQRLAAMKGAVGGVVLTMQGELIKSTLDPTTTIQVRYTKIFRPRIRQLRPWPCL